MRKTPRLDRMFSRAGHCLDVAIDHGMTNEASFLPGIENMGKAVRAIAAAGPDLIQLTPGMARHLDGLHGVDRPALALRADTSNVYNATLPRHTFAQVINGVVELAVSEDAVCIVTNLLLVPDEPELHHQCVRNVGQLKRLCDEVGMPLMVEPLVLAPNSAGPYGVDGDLHKISALVRQAAELGADIIKADPCDDPAEFHRVVEVATGVPVLVRGGGRVPDQVVLQRTAELMNQGAAGIVYGRNIFHHPNPVGMVRALMHLVHVDTSIEDAAALLYANAA